MDNDYDEEFLEFYMRILFVFIIFLVGDVDYNGYGFFFFLDIVCKGIIFIFKCKMRFYLFEILLVGCRCYF